MNEKLRYAIITPARNEEGAIERTIESMIIQTILPLKWVIVSDGSTDRTDMIVKSYLKNYPWIRFIRMPEHATRNFGAKVRCFNVGLSELKKVPYQIIGNLDADLSFERDYFEYLLSMFSHDESLGVAGTPFIEKNGSGYDYRFTSIEHVSGACQLFRKACFESIGGYVQVDGGGIDWIAVTTARMRGWKTRTFTERTLVHHRAMGTGSSSAMSARFTMGIKDYNRGNGMLWEISRCFYQMGKSPFVLGGLLMISGFFWATIRHRQRSISNELMEFSRMEQSRRLRSKLAFFKKGKS